jgi:hypothetical protein
MPSPSSTSSQGGGTLQRNQPIRVAQRPSFSKEGLLAGGGASGGQTNGIDLQRHMRQTSSTSANRFVVNNNDEKPTLNGGYPRRLPSSQSSHSMTTFPVSRPSERGSGGGGTLPPAYSYNHSRHQNSTASAYSTGHLGSSTAVKMQQQQNPTTSNYNNCTNGPAGSSKQYSSLNPAAGNSLSEAESVPARQQRLSQIGFVNINEKIELFVFVFNVLFSVIRIFLNLPETSRNKLKQITASWMSGGGSLPLLEAQKRRLVHPQMLTRKKLKCAIFIFL